MSETTQVATTGIPSSQTQAPPMLDTAAAAQTDVPIRALRAATDWIANQAPHIASAFPTPWNTFREEIGLESRERQLQTLSTLLVDFVAYRYLEIYTDNQTHRDRLLVLFPPIQNLDLPENVRLELGLWSHWFQDHFNRFVKEPPSATIPLPSQIFVRRLLALYSREKSSTPSQLAELVCKFAYYNQQLLDRATASHTPETRLHALQETIEETQNRLLTSILGRDTADPEGYLTQFSIALLWLVSQGPETSIREGSMEVIHPYFHGSLAEMPILFERIETVMIRLFQTLNQSDRTPAEKIGCFESLGKQIPPRWLHWVFRYIPLCENDPANQQAIQDALERGSHSVTLTTPVCSENTTPV